MMCCYLEPAGVRREAELVPEGRGVGDQLEVHGDVPLVDEVHLGGSTLFL